MPDVAPVTSASFAMVGVALALCSLFALGGGGGGPSVWRREHRHVLPRGIVTAKRGLPRGRELAGGRNRSKE